MLHQFVCENIKGDNVKSLPEVEVSNIHCFPLIHQAILLITESYQIDLTLTFPLLSVLSSPNYLLVLLIDLALVFQHCLLCHLRWLTLRLTGLCFLLLALEKVMTVVPPTHPEEPFLWGLNAMIS